MIAKIDSHLCVGCGICVMVCPGDVIRMSERTGKAHIKYPQDCWTCYNCEMDCPVDAIVVDPFKRQKPLVWKAGGADLENHFGKSR